MAVREGLIVSDARVLGGKPCVLGTRLTVEHVLELTAGGTTQAEILRQHPQLTSEGLAATFQYAVHTLRGEHMWELKIAL